jgi:hypothetical protein
MRYSSAIVVAVLLASTSSGAGAQNCETMPDGPARTDCYIALSRLYQAQSDLAAAKARAQTDAARYRQLTGKVPAHRRKRATASRPE